MTGIKLLRCLLRVQKILRIKRFDLNERKKELHLFVKPYKNGCLCPDCQRRSPIVREMPNEREWIDVRICGIMVYFHYTPKEILCPTHGRVQESIPWAAAYAQVTYRFEVLLLQYCQSMTQQDASGMLGISPSTASGILHRIINRIRDNHKIRGLHIIGIDEIAYHKGKKYATIVYDLKRGCVVWVGKGKGSETIDLFFQNCLSEFQKKQIRYASCDMSKAYIGAIKQWCPNAQLVLDRFHIVKALNTAVDDVRIEEWRSLKGKAEGSLVKGLRWLLYRHSSTRSKKQTHLLNNLQKSNRHIWRAWILKDEFEQFWDYIYTGAAENFAKAWMKRALLSRLEPIRKFVHTLKEHFDDIIAFIPTHLTNAASEGVNRVIKIVKNRASGFANLDCFIDMIFLTVGDVNIADQIPARFHLN